MDLLQTANRDRMKDHFIQVDPTVGLTSADVDRALQILAATKVSVPETKKDDSTAEPVVIDTTEPQPQTTSTSSSAPAEGDIAGALRAAMGGWDDDLASKMKSLLKSAIAEPIEPRLEPSTADLDEFDGIASQMKDRYTPGGGWRPPRD
eukprot:gnl/MRDRNA2_/MRDRNA2_56373_c0_seq2.p1 gnl/MRDRNA2_/MRDRNA2_56373_c0~~gnl/MRDRNA2_/MRDRNA2_56373_c0_seq2.p1  ORF type:complete len:149 (+),score=32.75 gnl/MRDRNA2_/MRDRNA2_56373_c0_seq2:225-671(+)